MLVRMGWRRGVGMIRSPGARGGVGVAWRAAACRAPARSAFAGGHRGHGGSADAPRQCGQAATEHILQNTYFVAREQKYASLVAAISKHYFFFC